MCEEIRKLQWPQAGRGSPVENPRSSQSLSMPRESHMGQTKQLPHHIDASLPKTSLVAKTTGSRYTSCSFLPNPPLTRPHCPGLGPVGLSNSLTQLGREQNRSEQGFPKGPALLHLRISPRVGVMMGISRSSAVKQALSSWCSCARTLVLRASARQRPHQARGLASRFPLQIFPP